MKKSLLLAALILAASAFSQNASAQSYGIAARQTPYIEVTGRAEKEIAPDQIYISIVINEKDYKNRSLTDIEKNMIKELERLNIDIKKNLEVKDLGSNFKKYFIKGNDAKLSKEYLLLVQDARTAGKVIIALENVGISQISIDRVDNSRLDEYRKELKIEAIKNAKANAALLSSTIGQTIGKAFFINDKESYYRQYDLNRIRIKGYTATAANKEADVPNLSFESIKIEASVLVWFELK